MIRVSLLAGNSSEAQSNILETEEVGGVRQRTPDVPCLLFGLHLLVTKTT